VTARWRKRNFSPISHFNSPDGLAELRLEFWAKTAGHLVSDALCEVLDPPWLAYCHIKWQLKCKVQPTTLALSICIFQLNGNHGSLGVLGAD